MPNKMNVYEITQMMRNRNALGQDMSEAMGMVQAMFKEKYMNRLHDAVREHHSQVEEKPSREVMLIQAIKAFMPEEKQHPLENMISTYQTMETLRSIRNEMHEIQMKTADTPESHQADPHSTDGYTAQDISVHADGVYDIDMSCMQSNKKNRPMEMAGLMLMMGLIARS